VCNKWGPAKILRPRMGSFLLLVQTLIFSTLWTAASLRLSRQRLRSASRHQLIVPQHRRTKFGRRAFSVAGPTAWNSLPDYLRDRSLSEDTFRRSLKNILVCVVLEHVALRHCLTRYINVQLYLLTHFRTGDTNCDIV